VPFIATHNTQYYPALPQQNHAEFPMRGSVVLADMLESLIPPCVSAFCAQQHSSPYNGNNERVRWGIITRVCKFLGTISSILLHGLLDNVGYITKALHPL